MGGDVIFERLKEHLDVGNDETTDDGKITLEHIECNAACDYAPVMMVNWEFFDNMTPESATELVDDLREGNEVHVDRAARDLHLARGRAGAGRLPRRPRRRGPDRAARRRWPASGWPASATGPPPVGSRPGGRAETQKED